MATDGMNRQAADKDEGKPVRHAHAVEPTTPSKILVFLLIIASLLVIITMAVGLLPRTKDLAKDDKYQAVFLTNGQVYFGKLSGANNHYLVLRQVYYLQTNDQQVQPNQEPAQDNNVSLVKLGNELHGPEDEMFIEKDKVIFWENLKDDGKVVQAIKNRQ